MTVLEALAILEAAVLECKKRDVDTPEMREALDFLEPHIYPQWLIRQCRDHVLGHDRTTLVALERQQQVLRATFPGIRDGVRELLGVRADALARKFHETHDINVKNELERLLREYGKLRDSNLLLLIPVVIGLVMLVRRSARERSPLISRWSSRRSSNW
jgi:hypothetical protein